jgi:hypothetical protein
MLDKRCMYNTLFPRKLKENVGAVRTWMLKTSMRSDCCSCSSTCVGIGEIDAATHRAGYTVTYNITTVTHRFFVRSATH